MSYGGNVEGYLLKIDGDDARTVFCILDEGMLQYFSHMGGELLGAVALSGSKVDVFLLDDIGQVPNQFRVDAQAQKSPVRRRNTRQPIIGNTTTSITFAGSTREVAHQWAISILNWNRHSWEDGQMICSTKDEYYNLQKIIKVVGLMTEKATLESVVPA